MKCPILGMMHIANFLRNPVELLKHPRLKNINRGSLRPYDEVLEGPDSFMAPKARQMLMQDAASSEEHRALLETIRDLQREPEANIQNKIHEIDSLVREFDPLHVIA